MTRMTGAIGALAAAVLLVAFTAGGAPASAKTQCGKASWYAMHSRTASGERANPAAMVAAHRSLPFGTLVKVENLNNGREVVVRINDRGPFVRGRVIDLSKGAAQKLGFVSRGTASVRVSIMNDDARPKAPRTATAAVCG